MWKLDAGCPASNSHNMQACLAHNGAGSHMSRAAVVCILKGSCVSLGQFQVRIQAKLRARFAPEPVNRSALAMLQQNFPYHWCSQSLKYLGIHLTISYPTLYHANYPPLFRDIDRLLHQWDTYPLSLLEWINFLKMSILPKLLCLFETFISFHPNEKAESYAAVIS